MSNKFIKQFLISSGILLLLCVLAVVIFDPFFQYHKPLFGLKAVLTDKEYQCTGSLKTFDYDSVIAGSSVAENYNNGWFDQGFGCRSIKAIRSYGATADLCYSQKSCIQPIFHLKENPRPSSSTSPVTLGHAVDSSAMVRKPG